jgi:CBS domain-containing protein
MSTNPYTPVTSVMSWPIATIDHGATVQEAAEALAADNVGAVLVLRDGALVGLLSERDVVAHVAAGAELAHLSVGDVMSGDLVTATTTTTVLGAARMMIEADVRHLPVLQDKLIAGVVSVRDLIAVLTDAVESDVVVVPSGTRVVVSSS